MEPVFFEAPAQMRAWFEKNHESAPEVVVGYWKKATGRPSVTWPESVDEALCFGWIDGIRRSLDGESYCIRFTPRRRGSTWSAVNIRRVEELTKLGRMRPAGLKAFEGRDEEKSRLYAFEGRAQELSPEYQGLFEAEEQAWAWYRSQAPSYRRAAAAWVMSAKQERTRERRLRTLIEDSKAGRRIAPMEVGRPAAGRPAPPGP